MAEGAEGTFGGAWQPYLIRELEIAGAEQTTGITLGIRAATVELTFNRVPLSVLGPILADLREEYGRLELRISQWNIASPIAGVRKQIVGMVVSLGSQK